jgi:hydrogenase expression/formation protein HypC
MRTAHGSGSNDVVNRCSRAWPIGDFARWRASAVPPDRWWQELGADALAIPASANLSGALLVQLSLQEHLKRRLYVEAFVRPPQGRTPAQFREAVVSGSGGVSSSPADQSAIGDELDLWRTAEIDFGGVRQQVSLACLPEARVGDQVLVHVGFALSVVEDAEETSP